MHGPVKSFDEKLFICETYHKHIYQNEIPCQAWSDSEEGETNKTSGLPNFIAQILADNEIAAGINSLNSKQREYYNVVHAWAKDYVNDDRHNVEPIHIFLSGSGDIGKSHLVKVIYNAI